MNQVINYELKKPGSREEKNRAVPFQTTYTQT